MVDIIGPIAAGWLDLIRNFMLVLIAPVLFIVGLVFQITSSTHQLIQRLTTPALLDTYRRVRLYRMFREGESKYDPYAPDEEGRYQHDLLFDLTITVNFYEGVCSEILQSKWTGGVWKGIVYKTVASLVIGTRNNLLVWLDELTSGGSAGAYPNIIKVADDCARWAARRGIPIVDRIPGPGNEKATVND